MRNTKYLFDETKQTPEGMVSVSQLQTFLSCRGKSDQGIAEKEEEMTENEFLLQDRIQKIQQIMDQYGEENFVMSWSGGKDSCVMSALFDMALPNNRIPRVYANTALDLSIMRGFIKEEMKRDGRIVEIKPTVNVKDMLEQDGYPFKSKLHSEYVERYQRLGHTKSTLAYMEGKYTGWNKKCPNVLKYQFSPDFKLKISKACCKKMKIDVIDNYLMENGYKYHILGLMASESVSRQNVQCFAFKSGELRAFQPLAPLTKEWEDWFIEKYEVRICDIYKPPYNNQRTGCKGCPLSLHLQEELDMLQEYFPNDRKACEKLWKPVYDEYRRIGYRLKKGDVYEED